MKKIIIIAIAAVATLGLSMSAGCITDQTKNSGENQKEKVEKVRKDKKTRTDKGDRKTRMNPFEGIELTEQQKTQLAELQPKKGEKKAPRLAPCCQGDSAACCQGEGQKCCWEITPEQARQQAADRLAKIKSILTPEQYQKYLENVATSRMMSDKKLRGEGNKRGMREGRRGGNADNPGQDKPGRMKGQRPEKKQE